MLPQTPNTNLFVIFITIFTFWSILLHTSAFAAKAVAKSHLCSKEEWQKNDADIAKLMSIGQFGRRFPENSTEIDLFWYVQFWLNLLPKN